MVEVVSLKEIRREFWEAWNGLSQVHTQEDLEAQSEKMWTARKRLMKVDSEFRAEMKAREEKVNAEIEESKRQIQSKHKIMVSEAEVEVSASMMKAKALMRMPDGELDEWIQKYKFKVITSEKAEIKSKLVCPICHGPDRHNIINGKAVCFECMHELVPESELKDYNRDYRRRWKRSRKR